MQRLLLSTAIAILLVCPCHAAQDALTNIKNLPAVQDARGPFINTGYVLVLPNGRRTVVEQALPNGYYRTASGEVISGQGVIVEGQDAGQSVAIDEEYAREHNIDLATARIMPEGVEPNAGAAGAGVKEPVANEPALNELPATPNEPARIELPTTPVEPEMQPVQEPANTGTSAIQAQPEKTEAIERGPLTIAEMLPTTAIRPEAPAKREQARAAQPGPAPENNKPTAQAKPKTPEKEKAKVEEKPNKQEKEKPQAKAKVGEEMRIPPEAIKTGNLGFLEGCWQGTRPEYFSKRTIKECFCFGASGKNGKRRIYDKTYNRQCIGATKATLAKNGILSVTSQGAACTDGERWGQAEMVCRNSGPRTPCSWVFRDANNGRQSYEIPFVRVESCGR